MGEGITQLINHRGLLKGSNTSVMLGSGLCILAFILYTIIFKDHSNTFYSLVKLKITKNFSWYYVLVVNICLFISIWIMLSQYGDIRLGRQDEQPQYSYFAWFAMLFGAGIAIGILFYSIAEPIFHYQDNPFVNAQEDHQAAMQFGLRASIFHWGLHGWGIFVVIGLSLSYFCYNKGLPLAIRSALYPLIGDKIYGRIGHCADSLGIIGTTFGIATSLGLGAQQINAGLSYLFDVANTTSYQILIIIVVSIAAIISVMMGLEKGIKRLSTINILMTFVLLMMFLIIGPTDYLLNQTISTIGDYLTHSIALGTWVNSNANNHWQSDWTLFYWGWWLSWAPFVGVFIARISRGRTIREFCCGVLLAPTLMGAIWISVFGSTAFYLEFFQQADIINAVNADTTIALFKTIESLTTSDVIATLLALLCTLMLVTYFITSADSATLVICSLVCVGDENPRTRYRLFWGAAIGGCAIALLLAGGLQALQIASVLSAFPFSIVILLSIIGLLKSLKNEIVTLNQLKKANI